MNRSLVCALTGAMVAFTCSAQAAGEGPFAAEVKRLAQPAVDAGLVPGMVVAVYDDARTDVYPLGTTGTDARTPPDEHTLYEIGSVSKVFTALLLADAVEHGEVKLDDALATLFPDGVKAPERDGTPITLEHLATHFSGLPRIPDNLRADSLDNPYADYTREKLFAFLKTCRLSRAPGTEYEYSNLGVGLLGTLLADKAKTDYATLLRDRITTPLHMNDTATRVSDEQKRRVAPGHRSGLPVPSWEFDALAGCGAIRSTAADMLTFVGAHVHPEGSPLAGAIANATRRRRDVANSPWSIALGWHIAGDKSTLWHNGQTGGYSAAVFVNPTLKKGVVVLANGADSTIDALGEKFLQSLAGMKVEPPKVRRSVPVADAQLDRLTGDYPSAFGFVISITRRGDALLAQLTGQPALRVFPDSPTKFFYREVEAELEFDVPKGAEHAAAVTLVQNGRTIRCDRKQ